jgi:hypothetical protein
MTRRVSLPGAAELFRSTGNPVDALPTTPLAVTPLAVTEMGSRRLATVPAGDSFARTPAPGQRSRSRRPQKGERQPTGRERHEEKITVYISAEELIDLEQARLVLRGDYAIAADRGRIVREAIAVVLADLDARGETSVLVQRLRDQ